MADITREKWFDYTKIFSNQNHHAPVNDFDGDEHNVYHPGEIPTIDDLDGNYVGVFDADEPVIDGLEGNYLGVFDGDEHNVMDFAGGFVYPPVYPFNLPLRGRVLNRGCIASKEKPQLCKSMGYGRK